MWVQVAGWTAPQWVPGQPKKRETGKKNNQQ
jgi:hypothetical protein